MIKMAITDEQIDAIAKARHRRLASTTIYDPEYSRKGVCGEVALREFFDINEHPPGSLPGGDGGIDVRIHLLDRDNRMPVLMTVDVKCAVTPTYLWVEEFKAKADIYVLARYNQKSRRAACIKWHWGEVVRAAQVTFYGKRHHDIPAHQCREMDELEARFKFKRCWCGENGNFGIDVNLRAGKLGRWVCYAHWRDSKLEPPLTLHDDDQWSLI
jgi:hypothetical protein